MPNTYTTTALVLKRRDWGDHDRLFCLYTKDYGKIDVIAKGTKKISSKLNSYMEPFYLIKVMIAKGKKIDRLCNCDLIKPYQNLRSDCNLLGFYLINYLTEINDGLIHGQISDVQKFDLLINTLEVLDEEFRKSATSADNPSRGLRMTASADSLDKQKLFFLANVYVYKLMNLLGYQPEIKRCLHCHKGILLTKNVFDFAQGGIICEECKKVCLIEDYIYISDGVIKLLQLADEKDLEDLINLKIKQEDLTQFNQVIYKLILTNMERPVKSIDFFQITC